jgi:hypothetical protein
MAAFTVAYLFDGFRVIFIAVFNILYAAVGFLFTVTYSVVALAGSCIWTLVTYLPGVANTLIGIGGILFEKTWSLCQLLFSTAHNAVALTSFYILEVANALKLVGVTLFGKAWPVCQLLFTTTCNGAVLAASYIGAIITYLPEVANTLKNFIVWTGGILFEKTWTYSQLAFTITYNGAVLAASYIWAIIAYLPEVANTLKNFIVWTGGILFEKTWTYSQLAFTITYNGAVLAASYIWFGVTCLPELVNTLIVFLIWIGSTLWQAIWMFGQVLMHAVIFIYQVTEATLQDISSVLGITSTTIIVGAILLCALHIWKLPRKWRSVKSNVPADHPKQADSDPSDNQCVVCWSQQKQVILLPCRHLCLCKDCNNKIKNRCPLCQGSIEESLTVFT